jgi:hypothetical protein
MIIKAIRILLYRVSSLKAIEASVKSRIIWTLSSLSAILISEARRCLLIM